MQRWKQNKKLTLLFFFVLLLLILLVLTLPAAKTTAKPQSVDSFNLSWNVVANGGTTMSSTSYTLLSTSGQPVVGESASDTYTLVSGYWSDLRTFITEIFFPIFPIS